MPRLSPFYRQKNCCTIWRQTDASEGASVLGASGQHWVRKRSLKLNPEEKAETWAAEVFTSALVFHTFLVTWGNWSRTVFSSYNTIKCIFGPVGCQIQYLCIFLITCIERTTHFVSGCDWHGTAHNCNPSFSFFSSLTWHANIIEN